MRGRHERSPTRGLDPSKAIICLQIKAEASEVAVMALRGEETERRGPGRTGDKWRVRGWAEEASQRKQESVKGPSPGFQEPGWGAFQKRGLAQRGWKDNSTEERPQGGTTRKRAVQLFWGQGVLALNRPRGRGSRSSSIRSQGELVRNAEHQAPQELQGLHLEAGPPVCVRVRA